MKDTSLEAHLELLKHGIINKQEKVIMDTIVTPKTSREISKLTGYERSSVTGRLNGLCNKMLAMEFDKVKCSTTGKTVHRYITI